MYACWWIGRCEVSRITGLAVYHERCSNALRVGNKIRYARFWTGSSIPIAAARGNTFR